MEHVFKMSYFVYRFCCPYAAYFGIGSIFGTCKNLGFGHSLFLSKTYIIKIKCAKYSKHISLDERELIRNYGIMKSYLP